MYEANDTVELSEDAPWWVKKEEMLGDKFFTEDCQAGKHLELRLNAQVMLLRNETSSAEENERRYPTARRLVNGSRAIPASY